MFYYVIYLFCFINLKIDLCTVQVYSKHAYILNNIIFCYRTYTNSNNVICLWKNQSKPSRLLVFRISNFIPRDVFVLTFLAQGLLKSYKICTYFLMVPSSWAQRIKTKPTKKISFFFASAG